MMTNFKTTILILIIFSLYSCKPQVGSKLFDSSRNIAGVDDQDNGGDANDDEVIIPGQSPASQGDNCDGSIWGFNDPLVKNQWHLCNSAQAIPRYTVPGESEQDGRFLNSLVKYSGKGITFKVTDSGLETTHEDMAANYSGMGKDFCANANAQHDSAPVVKDPHGSMVTGIIAARGKNGIGVAGISHQAKVSADNLISECQSGNTATKFTNAITFAADVWNGSYGFGCNAGWIPINSEALTMAAYTAGAVGNDTVYVKSNGNDRSSCRPNGNVDPSNAHPYVLSIAAVDNKGLTVDYSSQGPNLAMSGFAGYGYDARPGICTITTNGQYTCAMNGTSAASPFVAGVVGLIREANPNLKFIDVHSILMRTARKTKDTDYIKNDAGYEHSWNAGYGLTDGDSAVKLAETYKNYLDTPVLYSEEVNNDTEPSNATAVNFTANACGSQTINIANDFQIFATDFKFDINVNTDIRNLELFVTTPGGKRFPLHKTSPATYQDRDQNNNPITANYNLGNSLGYGQVLMSKQFFGMQMKGNWIFEACNTQGTFNGVRFDAYGWANTVIPNKK